jgi:hypothetical protein
MTPGGCRNLGCSRDGFDGVAHSVFDAFSIVCKFEPFRGHSQQDISLGFRQPEFVGLQNTRVCKHAEFICVIHKTPHNK